MPPEANETKPEVDDDFANVFDQIKMEGEEPVIGKSKTPEELAAEAAAAAAATAAKEPVITEVLPPSNEETAEQKTARETAEAAAAAAAETPEAKAAREAAEAEAARVAAEKTKATPQADEATRLANDELIERLRKIVSTPPDTARTPEPEPAVTPFTEDENKVVKEYQTEYPGIFAAEQLIRRQEYQALCSYIFGQIAPLLTAQAATTQALTQQTHVDRLYQEIPDYDQTVPEVVAWVATQPQYKKVAYEHVLARGSIEECVDLVNTYRAATGKAAPGETTPDPAAAAAAAAATAAAEAKRQQAINLLKPVAGKRSDATAQSQISPEDYTGAFAAFAAAEL